MRLIAMGKGSLTLFLSTILGLLCNHTASRSQVSHCLYGTSVQDLLKLSGIKGADLLSYVGKLKKHNIDETVLSSLTVKQFHDIGITPLGDRLKIYNFFSKDVNDCSSSSCRNNAICRDGFRCFSCICDPKRGYYGPRCELKCPCFNGGVCKTTRTGFKCVCPPGYSGDLCKMKYLTEERVITLEKTLKQLTTRLEKSEKQLKEQEGQMKDLKSHRGGTWTLHRANKILNQLEKLQLSSSKPTFTQKLPVVLPPSTRAILVSVYCHFRNRNGHAYLNYITYQKGNDNASAKAEGYNTHYNVYANTWLYEQMIPWNSTFPNELIFKVISSFLSGGSNNWYRIRFVGYITSE